MTKKSLTILILFLLVILGTMFFGYQLFKSDAPSGEETVERPRRNFFFFGNNDTNPNTNTPGPVDENNIPSELSTSTPVINIPKLRQLTTDPTAGAIASSTENTTLIRYINRGTGHAHENNMDSLANSVTISNTTIPKIYEAIWNKNGTKVLFRYTSDEGLVRTFSADLLETKPETGTSTQGLTKTLYELKGIYLSSNINNIALSPKTDRMFYLTEGENGAVGYLSALNETSRTQIFDSSLSKWIPEWPEESTVTLTNSPTAIGSGYLYFLNTKTGVEKKILGPVRGLTTRTSKDAQKVIYSRSQGNSLQTALYNVKEDETEEVPFITLPEKCVWGNLNKNDLYCAVPIEISPAYYPDHWYQGKVSFIDKIWYINTETGEARLLGDLFNESGKSIDAVNLSLDHNEDYLVFTNKNDLTLWSLDISE